MNLQELFDDQAEFNTLFRDSDLSQSEKVHHTKELILHCHSELDEILRCLPDWRSHRKLQSTNSGVNTQELLEELTDLLKYLVSIYLVHGFTAKDLYYGYKRKSATCKKRYSEEFLKDIYSPSIIVDCDNVLCDYVGGLLDYIRERRPDLSGMCDVLGRTRQWISYSTLEISEKEWNNLIHRFRIDGRKRTLPLMPHAKEFLDQIKKLGLQIIMLTSRPVIQYPNIESDTREWIENNQLPIDRIWWAEQKANYVISKEVLKYIKVFIDDDVSQIKAFRKLGIPTVQIQHNFSIDSLSLGSFQLSEF